MKFRDLNLPSKILKAIENMGYEELTPVQEATYTFIMEDQDVCTLAETGSGKTAACAIPLIQKIDPELNAIQALVLVPTRELCLQYVMEIGKIAAKTNVVPFAIYGGFDKGIQKAKLNHKVHILVATPGRLIDLLYDGAINLEHVQCTILDEADELLKVGFLDDITFIMSCIMHEHQTLLFAATMADEIKKLTHKCLHNPKHISLIQKRAAPLSIEHYFGYLHPKQKQSELLKYLDNEKVSQVIIFCNARYKVDALYRKLRNRYKDIKFIHAGLSQDRRTSIFRQFKKKSISHLIATDVAGRGLDFTHVSHIINWDFPGDGEQYTHRTGRSGRMGRKGKAYTLVTRQDLNSLRKLIRNNRISPSWIGEDPFQESNKSGRRTPRGNKKSYRSWSGKQKKR